MFIRLTDENGSTVVVQSDRIQSITRIRRTTEIIFDDEGCTHVSEPVETIWELIKNHVRYCGRD